MTQMKLVLGFGVAALFMSAAPVALAQAAPASGPMPSAGGEITVTALRTVTNIQKTPVTVQAFSAQQLKNQSVENLSDVSRIVPAVRFKGEGNVETGSITMRGLGAPPAGGATGGTGAAVLVYENDVNVLGFAIGLASSYDLAGIQVLEGPQGTLFGGTAIGGAVLYNTVQPSFQQNGYVHASVGNYNYWDVDGAANLTIVPDVLAVRIAGQAQERAGYITSTAAQTGFASTLGKLNSLDTQSVRGSVLFTPTSHIKDVLVVDYFHESDTGVPSIQINPVGHLAAVGATGAGYTSALLGPNFAALAATDAARLAACNHMCVDFGPNNTVGQMNNMVTLTNTLTWELNPNVTVKDIYGYHVGTSSISIDSDASPATSFNLTTFAPAQYMSNEFQILGNFGRFHPIIGVYYQASNPTNAPTASNFGGAFLSSFATWSNTAVYFNLTTDITSKLKLRGGFRYTWDTQSTYFCGGFALTVASPSTCVSRAKALPLGSGITTVTDSAPTWSVGLDYQLTDDIFLYARGDRAYRASGANNGGIYRTPCDLGSTNTYNAAYNPAIFNNAGTPATTNPVLKAANPTNPAAGATQTGGLQTPWSNPDGTPVGGPFPDVSAEAAYDIAHNILDASGQPQRCVDFGFATTGVASGHSLNAQPLAIIKPEILNNVEVGLRSTWMLGDWRTRFNIAYFHYDYTNVRTLFQLGAPNGTVLGGGVNTPGDTENGTGAVALNAYNLSANGIESDVTVNPTRDLTLDLNWSYFNQKLTSIVPPPGFPAGINLQQHFNLSLNLPTPTWALTASVNYVLPWHPLHGNLVLNYNYYYTGPFQDQNRTVPGYDLHNARVEWEDIGNTNLSLGFWIRNIGNTVYIDSAVDLAGNGTANYGEPRMFGIDATYKFH